MKLKSQCTEHIIAGSMDDITQDAAYAHALVEAIELCGSRDTNGYIFDKADEIMRGFGYTDE